jgi:hypothetical protein
MFSRGTWRCALSCVLITLVVSSLLFEAQGDDLDNIVFQGKAYDSSGAVIPDAIITALHVQTGTRREATTDPRGEFRLTVTLSGAYRVSAKASGFQEASVEVDALSGRSITLDFKLTPAVVSEQITVSASSAPLIDTTRTVLGDSIDRRELEELPIVNRDVLQLVLLLGGAADAPLSTSLLADEGRGVFLRDSPEEAGAFSITGAPATSNNITIDGLDNNDDRQARERITLNPEAIEEVQVITNQYAAEYGRASGGRINIRTRSGGNLISGTAYLFFGDESLNANTYFRNSRGLKRIPRQDRRAGLALSGPIKKDRAHFFSSYERLDVTDSVEVSALLPAKTNPLFPLPAPDPPSQPGAQVGLFFGEISTPENRNLINIRGDVSASPSHNLAVRADLVKGANRRGFPGGGRLPETILVAGRDSDSISFSDNLIFRKLINQARVQYSRLLPRNKTSVDSIGVVIDEPGRVVAGSFTGSESGPAFSREERRVQFQENLSLLVGRHLLKTGLDVQFINSTFTDLFATTGQYTFDEVEDFLSNNPARFIQRFGTASRLSNNVAGIFIQDDWRVGSNLSLSFGARWDNESILKDRDNISPRLAIAWDPFGGRLARKGSGLRTPGVTVVRAGFGIFYNRALLRTLDDYSLGASKIILDSDITPALLQEVRFPHPVADPRTIARHGVSEKEFLRRISDELEIPYTIQTGIGVERQFGRRLVIAADYIFTRGAHLWRETNINAPLLPTGFSDFTDFLLSRDFDNRPAVDGRRPISAANAEVVRFDLGTNTATTRGAITSEHGLRVLRLGLNAPRSSNISAALSAIRMLRPDPSLTQVEMLESTGNSFYHGGIFSARYSRARGFSFRATYTLSKLIDEGTTNTASPQDLLDRRAERALSLQDQRHRIGFSSHFQVPYLLLDFATAVSLGSSRPFSIGAGVDRNLNDIENDRPRFKAGIGRPRWRKPGDQPSEIRTMLELAPIGSSGDLPRNFGIGPGTQAVSLRVSRTFALTERIKARAAADVYNPFNSTVFSFGAEFINRDDADFLLARRTGRPRIVELSLRLNF